MFIGLASDRLHVLQRWAPTRHLAATATVALGILRSPRSLTQIFGLSFVVHGLTAVLAWCAARSVNAELPLLYALFLVLPVVLIAIVPISVAGWGVREGVMVAAFGYAGLPPSDGLIVSLLFGASYLALGAVGGVVWVVTTRRVGRNAMPATRRGESAQSGRHLMDSNP